MPKVKNPRIPRKNSIVWKAALVMGSPVLVKLKVLGDIIRPNEPQHGLYNNKTGIKYRTDKAEVLGIYERKLHRDSPLGWSYCEWRRGEEIKNATANSSFVPAFKYKTGEIVKTNLDRDVTRDCSDGIHFFRTQSEALHYF